MAPQLNNDAGTAVFVVHMQIDDTWHLRFMEAYSAADAVFWAQSHLGESSHWMVYRSPTLTGDEKEWSPESLLAGMSRSMRDL